MCVCVCVGGGGGGGGGEPVNAAGDMHRRIWQVNSVSISHGTCTLL